MKFKLLVNFFIAFIYFQTSFSQNHVLIDTSDIYNRNVLKADFDSIFSVKREAYKYKYRGRLRKEILRQIDLKKEKLELLITKKRFLFDERYTSFADSLLHILTQNNKELKNYNYKAYISKEPLPNAISIGDGIIILHIGLFSHLQTPEQLLSVIAHEIAHDYLNHSENALIDNATYNAELGSKGNKIKKRIKQSKYGRGQASFEILKHVIYQKGILHRKKEQQADSLGYLFFKNSSSITNEFPNALKLISKFDSIVPFQIDSIALKKIFNKSDDEFKEALDQISDFEKYNYGRFKDLFSKDSLNTHPKINERLDFLYKMYNVNTSVNNITQNIRFINLKRIAKTAFIENLYHTNQLDIGLYNLLYRHDVNKNAKHSEYINYWIGIYLKTLAKAKKTYTFNRYVERVNPEKHDKSYQLYLSLLWNLSLSDLNSYGDYYLKISQD